MCELLGFAEADMAFESQVPSSYTNGAEGPVQLYSGKCVTLAYAWDFTKGGGAGPK